MEVFLMASHDRIVAEIGKGEGSRPAIYIAMTHASRHQPISGENSTSTR